MKKVILVLTLVIISFTVQGQNDIIYTDNTIILDCKVTNIKGDKIVYIKDNVEHEIVANSFIHNGIKIDLEKFKREKANTPQNQITIGDRLQGGIVFFVDETGQSGLVAAPFDQTEKEIRWGKNSKTYARSRSDGYKNTKLIVQYFNSHSVNTSAAHLCDNLELNGFDDWYLPAIEELMLMYNNKMNIGGFIEGDYCSSTEYGREDSYSIHFRRHRKIEFYYNKNDRDYFVRCIRKFKLNNEIVKSEKDKLIKNQTEFNN